MKLVPTLAVLSVAAALAACGDTDGGTVAGVASAGGTLPRAVKLAGAQTCAAAPNDTIFLADNDTLSGQVDIPAGCRVRVRPAESAADGDDVVTIYGDAAVSPSVLVIQRGARIFAEGSASAPIVFRPTGTAPRPGDWGGIVIIGRAPANTAGATVEGIPGGLAYGGTDPADDSGVLRYVRIEDAGYRLAADRELNALSLYGVGSGTTLEYVQAHRALDDGIEFFGGTAALRFAVVTGAGDDGLDYAYGWTGKAQFLLVQQSDTAGDKGIEADNNDAGDASVPVTGPEIWNVTLVGRDTSIADSTAADPGNVGVQVRHNASGRVRNAVVLGFDHAFDGTGAAATAQDSLTNAIFFARAGYTTGSSAVANVATVHPHLERPFVRGPLRDFRPRIISPANSGGFTVPVPGMINTSFRGAVPRVTINGISPTWYTGWTTWAY